MSDKAKHPGLPPTISEAKFLDDYQRQAFSTVCDQSQAKDRINHTRMLLLHSIVGIQSELGEIATILENVIWYGQGGLDLENRHKLLKEFGDIQWYLAEGVTALDNSLKECLTTNIDKLRRRYPNGKWEAERAERGQRLDEGYVKVYDIHRKEMRTLEPDKEDREEFIPDLVKVPDPRDRRHGWEAPNREVDIAGDIQKLTDYKPDRDDTPHTSPTPTDSFEVYTDNGHGWNEPPYDERE